MKYLFSQAGLHALSKIDLSKTLLAFDFDGTLAPEVNIPEDARTPSASVSLIKDLMKKTEVAVISGRAIEDLKPKLGFRPQFLLGNHGLQSPWTKEQEAQARRTVKLWVRDLKKGWPFPKDSVAFIEDKRSSLSLHFRNVQDPKRAERLLRKLAATLNPRPRVVGGKFVVNLTLKTAPHKGSALLQVMKRTNCKMALFAGDDATDEDVFRLKKKSLFTVRVGKHRSSRAHFYVQDQKEFAQLLRYLLNH